jgi:hypothetical protein
LPVPLIQKISEQLGFSPRTSFRFSITFPTLKPMEHLPNQRRSIMKALIIALALVTLVAAPSFAQPSYFGPHSSSPASPNYGGGGY